MYSIVFFSLSVQAETQVIGVTYAIAEPDALQEIRKTADTVTWEKYLHSRRSSAADNWARIPDAAEDKTRIFTPVYVTPFDVTDKDGTVVYPAGFRYNVLEHVRLPMRIAAFKNEPEHLEWIREHRQEFDILLLADNGLDTVIEALGATVYLLNRNIQERLGIERLPCIVEQEHHHFLIREFNLERAVH